VIAHALLSVVQADTIVIRDAKTGAITAEVNIDAANSKFVHAGRALIIERKAPVMELRARKLQIPRVEFREASLEEVARGLRQPNPYSEEPPDSRPVINIVIIDQAKRKLSIDLRMEDVSMFGFFSTLAKKYGLTIAYDDHAIIVTDPK